jgi:hypothetical protein
VFDDLMIMLDCFLPSYAHAALSLLRDFQRRHVDICVS